MINRNLQSNLTRPIQTVKEEQSGHVVLLELNQNKILEAIESFSIGFIQLDFNWKIRYWNQAAEKLTGYKQTQTLDKNLFDVVKEMNHIEFYRTWQNSLKSQQVVQFKDYFWPTQKWFEFHLYSSGEDIIVHFRDITKKFITRKTLTRKITQLREVSMFNSHALRRPLANLIGLTNLLDENIKLSEFREYVFNIKKSAKNLDEAIGKINAMANDCIENDHICSPEHFYLKDILIELKEGVARDGNNHYVIFKCSNVLFFGNREGIKQSIKALICNGIRHSHNLPKINVNIWVSENNLHICVQDCGKGIPERSLAEIHSTLISNRLETDKNKISKIARLCFQHNGTFWIDNLYHKGTRCYMLFPLSNFSIFKTSHSKKPLTEIIIHYDPNNQCVEVKWNGYFDNANVKKSFYKIYEVMKTHRCSKVINNEIYKIGPGINSIKWLLKYGFPLLLKAGLSHFAWINSKNEFARLSASHVVKTLNMPSVIKDFPRRTPAIKWINEISKSSTK